VVRVVVFWSRACVLFLLLLVIALVSTAAAVLVVLAIVDPFPLSRSEVGVSEIAAVSFEKWLICALPELHLL
jgi:hypothetical protein